MTSKQELAWLAGLLEGEGSFMLSKNWVTSKGKKKCYFYPLITISMTDRDVIERVAIMFGNKVYNLKPASSGWKPQFQTALTGKKAVKLMQKLRPFMGFRRQAQIDKSLVNVVP